MDDPDTPTGSKGRLSRAIEDGFAYWERRREGEVARPRLRDVGRPADAGDGEDGETAPRDDQRER